MENMSVPRSNIEAYLATVSAQPSISLNLRRALALTHTPHHPVPFSWDIPRTREGFYHYRAGIAAATKRARAFAPYADLLWLETGDPNVKKAASFAADIRTTAPGKWFVYNLSPSFNWSAHGFDDKSLQSFIWDLAKEGFVLQLVSLAGLHSNAAVTCDLSRRFKTEGMKAYVEVVQRYEKDLGCDVLTHQKWSGAGYVDGMLGGIQSGSSGSKSMGEGNTEGQF